MRKSLIHAGIVALGFSALAASHSALADMNCEDIQKTYDRKPQLEKPDGYYVPQDEAIDRGGVGGYVQVVPGKDQKLAHECGQQQAQAQAQAAGQAAGTAPGSEVVSGAKENQHTIYFDLNKSNLDQKDLALLEPIAELAKNSNNPQAILIEGYADKTGTTAQNQDLSDARAESVEKYLASQGVSTKQIQIVAHGDQQAQPVNTPEGNPQDRKVVISVS
jgi:outer membrane protein OmpA-like peptidoglycan-associated protein